MTYAELQAQIAGYIHRTDLTSEIQDFIETTRTRINRELRVREMLIELTSTPTTNPFNAPIGFLEMRDIYHNRNGNRVSLVMVGRKQLNLYASSNISQSNPRFYSIDGTRIETAPGGEDVEFTQLFYREETELTNGIQEHATMLSYPSIWLYGSLIEAHRYVQNMELMASALEFYNSEVSAANEASKWTEAGPGLQMQGASTWV